jgi:hypothetical protein
MRKTKGISFQNNIDGEAEYAGNIKVLIFFYSIAINF